MTLNAVHAQYVEKVRLNEIWTLGDAPISQEPLIRISQNLARKYFRT